MLLRSMYYVTIPANPFDWTEHNSTKTPVMHSWSHFIDVPIQLLVYSWNLYLNVFLSFSPFSFLSYFSFLLNLPTPEFTEHMSEMN